MNIYNIRCRFIPIRSKIIFSQFYQKLNRWQVSVVEGTVLQDSHLAYNSACCCCSRCFPVFRMFFSIYPPVIFSNLFKLVACEAGSVEGRVSECCMFMLKRTQSPVCPGSFISDRMLAPA